MALPRPLWTGLAKQPLVSTPPQGLPGGLTSDDPVLTADAPARAVTVEIIGTTAGPQIIAAAGLAPDLRAHLTVAAEEDR